MSLWEIEAEINISDKMKNLLNVIASICKRKGNNVDGKNEDFKITKGEEN